MNMLLKLSIDIVEQIKPKELIANDDFVSFLQQHFGDGLSVDSSPIRRTQIGEPPKLFSGFWIALGREPSVKSRSASVVDPHISVERTAECYDIPFERNRHGQPFAS